MEHSSVVAAIALINNEILNEMMSVFSMKLWQFDFSNRNVAVMSLIRLSV